MRTALVVFPMVVRRSLANRRLLATVVVGVVMAAALMASVVLYADAVRDLGLRHALETAEPADRNVRIVISGRPALADYQQRRQSVDGLLERHLGGVLEEVVRFGRTATFFVAEPGQPVPEDPNRPRGHFQFADELAGHVRVVEGSWPAPPVPGTGTARPEIGVAIGKAAADEIGVGVGDTFDLHPFWREDVAPVRVVVSGIIEPIDLADPYWFGRTDRFLFDTTWDTFPFWVDEAVVLDVLAGYLPEMDSTLETFGFVNIGAIDARNADLVEGNTRALGLVLRESIPNVVYETRLADVISTYQTKLFFTRLPLFALMLQIVGIALFYLVMVSSMLVERQHGEIALLRSRGGSPAQVVGVFAIEGLLICGAGAIAGPFLAAAGISVLGYTPPFAALSGNAALDVPLSGLAFVAAGGGALLAFVAMLIPAWRASRSSTIDYKHSLARPQVRPLFLRYYLDLVLVGVGAFLFYQLRERGSLVTERLFGELTADPLLLLSPTLFMVMVALVFLRLFPLALGAIAWAGRRWESATVELGLVWMTRAPMQYNRLILLLLLATAVGMFAAGYRATLERGYDDRAAYQAGAPARLVDVRNPAAAPNGVFVERVASATEAEVVSPVSRQTGSYFLSAFQGVSVEVLGVVPGEFEQVAFWRGDFADAELGELLARLPVDVAGRAIGPEVPPGSRWIGLWARFPYANNQARLSLRLRDPDGTFWDYTLTPTVAEVSNEWRFFVADLTQPAQARFGRGATYSMATPKELDAIYVRSVGLAPPVAERAIVLVDEVQVSAAAAVTPDLGNTVADWVVIEPFESFERYELIVGQARADAGAVSFAPDAGRDGGNAARIAFGRGPGQGPLFGFRVARPDVPLPVLAEGRFLELAGLGRGDVLSLYVNRQYVDARIVGSFDYFPGHVPRGNEYLFVADLRALQELGAAVPGLADAVHVNEAWMSGASARLMSREALLERGVHAERVYERGAIRAGQEADPLVAASWEGILFLSFGAVLVLTGLGFAVYASVAAQARALEFAILRTMGYSSRQVLGLVSFEQMFVIVAGVVVGTLLGFPLGRLMIGYLGVTEAGEDPVPPLVAQVSWPAVLTVYLLFAAVFVATITALATVYTRLAVHRALRIGEM
jgi:ABC-type lipoprotein release transport system permease subunit